MQPASYARRTRHHATRRVALPPFELPRYRKNLSGSRLPNSPSNLIGARCGTGSRVLALGVIPNSAHAARSDQLVPDERVAQGDGY